MTPPEPWTDTELQRALKMKAGHCTAEQIGEVIGRSKGAVTRKFSDLRKTPEQREEERERKNRDWHRRGKHRRRDVKAKQRLAVRRLERRAAQQNGRCQMKPDKPTVHSDWKDEIVERLKQLVTGADYYSNSDIALALNLEFGTAISRNAVIGKKLRLGLSGREPPRRAKSPVARPRPRPPRKPFVPQIPRSTTVAQRIEARALDLAMSEKTDIAPTQFEAEIPMGQRCTLMDLTDAKCRWPVGEPGTPEFYFCGGEPVGEFVYCAYHARIAYTPRALATKSPWLAWDRKQRA